MNHNTPEPPPPEDEDPQAVIIARIKDGENGKADTIIFSIFLLKFRWTFIIPIPDEDERTVPVYIKHKLIRSRS
jgi:hypothetical protein